MRAMPRRTAMMLRGVIQVISHLMPSASAWAKTVSLPPKVQVLMLVALSPLMLMTATMPASVLMVRPLRAAALSLMPMPALPRAVLMTIRQQRRMLRSIFSDSHKSLPAIISASLLMQFRIAPVIAAVCWFSLMRVMRWRRLISIMEH